MSETTTKDEQKNERFPSEGSIPWTRGRITKVHKIDDGQKFTSIMYVEEGKELEVGIGINVDRALEPVDPKPGDLIEVFGDFGRPVRGIAVRGRLLFFHSPLRQAARHKAWADQTSAKYDREYRELMDRIKDEPEFETGDITGFGGGYERAVQIGLKAGLEWAKDHPGFVPKFKQSPQVTGVAIVDDKSWMTKDFQEVISKALGGGMSGAQHQAILNHAAFILEKGRDAWLNMMREQGRAYVYPRELPAPAFGRDKKPVDPVVLEVDLPDAERKMVS